MTIDLRDRLTAADRVCVRELSRRAEWSDQLETLTRSLVDAESRLSSYEGAVEILQKVADLQRAKTRDRIEEIVDTAIKCVFGNHMSFRFEESNKRNTINIEPQIGYRDGSKNQWCSMVNVGGGVADVVSFCLRVTTLSLMKNRVPQIIIADEPFKWVSASYLPAVADMLKSLCNITGIQMLIVSHEIEIAIAADKTYRVEKNGKFSELKDNSNA